VLEALEAADVVVDRVAGASLGAMIAAMHAAGMDAAEIDARCYEELVRRNPLGDYRVLRFSLIRGERRGRCWSETSRHASRSSGARSSA